MKKKLKNYRRQAKQVPVAMPAGVSREPTFVLIALFLGLIAYIILAIVLPSPPAATSMAKLLIPELLSETRPEPREKFLYVFGLFSILTLPALFYWLLMRWNRRFYTHFSWLESRRLVLARDILVVVGCMGWLFFLTIYSEIPNIRLLLGIAAGGAFLLALLIRWNLRWHRYVVYGIAGLLLLMLSDTMIGSDDLFLSRADLCYHFNPLLGAVMQTIHGSTALIDFFSQYGVFYPYVAALALAPFELTAQHVMLFFVAIGVLTFVFTYLTLSRKTGAGSPLTLLFFVGVAGVQHPFMVSGIYNFQAPLAYYQNYPLRVVFGMFFMWFVSVYFARKSRRLTLLGYAVAGFSALWNLDTGMVILIAWTSTLIFDAVATHSASIRKMFAGALIHASMFILTLVLSVGFYSLFAWLRSGQFPKLENFYVYQKNCYVVGYFMLPMNPLEFWQPIIFVYLVTVFYCVRKLLQNTADASVKWYFFIALYGLGIFSYYQGRSHVQCLGAVPYPAVILSSFLAVDFLKKCQSAHWRQLFTDPGYRYTFLKLILCLLLPAFGIVNFCRCLPDAIRFTSGEPTPPPMIAQSEPLFQLLRKHIGNSQPVILSPISNYLYLNTNSYSKLPFGSSTDIWLLSQVQEVQDILDRDDTKCVVIQQVPGAYGAFLSRLRFDKFQIAARMGDFIVMEKIHDQRNP